MNLSKRNQQKIRMYSHYDRDVDEFDDIWFILTLAGTLIGLWWGIIHLIYLQQEMTLKWGNTFAKLSGLYLYRNYSILKYQIIIKHRNLQEI